MRSIFLVFSDSLVQLLICIGLVHVSLEHWGILQFQKETLMNASHIQKSLSCLQGRPILSLLLRDNFELSTKDCNRCLNLLVGTRTNRLQFFEQRSILILTDRPNVYIRINYRLINVPTSKFNSIYLIHLNSTQTKNRFETSKS